MKKILIPTDFSVNAGYALNYGAAFAASVNASITIVHAFNIPVITDAAVVEQSLIDGWQKENKAALKLIKDRFLAAHPGLDIHTESIIGFAADEILGLSDRPEYDIIIMGSKGTGDIGDNLFGNVTADVIRRSKKPVLVIPPGMIYKKVTKVALACNNDGLMTPQTVNTITDFVKACKAKMYIVDIVREPAMPLNDAENETNLIKDHFGDLGPSVHIIKDEKVVHGVNAFADENEVDVIILISRKHSLFERVFTEIHTRHMTKASHRPFLEIPEN